MKTLVVAGLMLTSLGLGACSSTTMFHQRMVQPGINDGSVTPNVNSNMLGKVPPQTPVPAPAP